jgi:hypothetical protein
MVLNITLNRLLVVLVFFSLTTARAADTELLAHGGMEGPFADGLSQGWAKNCYGSNTVAFAEESHDIHGGKSAQRVTCSAFVIGGVQFHSSGVAVEKGKPYTLRFWMKGDVNVPVTVVIRKRGEPYTRYLTRQVRVKREWTPYLIMGEASGSDPACAVFFMFAGTGTVWVDDVSLMPGLHEEAITEPAEPPQKGNRLYNSGFEAGLEGWTPVNGWSLDSTVAHSGRFSARVPPTGIECRPFPVRTGRRYTLSAWIRASEPKTRVRLRFFEWADAGGDQPANRQTREAQIVATTEWVRYQVSGIVLPNLFEDYVARITPSAPVWLDDVQIEEGGSTAYAPAQPVEVGAETATRWCRVGEAVEVVAHVAGQPPAVPTVLHYTLEDLWSRPLETVDHTLTTGTVDRVTFQMKQPGMCRVRVQADRATATGEVWFGVFPKRDRGLRPASPFGTHVTAVAAKPTNTLLLSEAMGARWVRLHDFGDFCHWRVVEPEKGRFVWRDEEINALRDRGFMILANLGHPPLWAGRTHPDRKDHGDWTDAPPRDRAEWETYVFKTVEHFKDRIHLWEVWNEPCWQSFFSGTPEEYADLLKATYRTIKRADPQAVVIGGCFSSHAEEWTRRVLAQGALESMDALSYHVYWSPPLTESAIPGEPPLITRQVQRFTELMREYGQMKPIYMTEGGIRCPPFASWLPKEGFERGAPFGSQAGAGCPLSGADAASGLVRGMVQMLSAGVVNVCYYYTGGLSGAQGAMPWYSAMANGYYVLTDYEGRPKPTLMAYSALESALGDARPAKVICRDGLTAHLFAHGKGAVAVVWSDRARPLVPPAGTAALDLMGNPLKGLALNAGEPAYLCAPRHSPADLADALR